MKDISKFIGEKYNKLTILKDNGWSLRKNGYKNKRMVLCKCDCGNEKSIALNYIIKNIIKACGCYVGEKAREFHFKHGMIKTTEYNIWNNMKRRCAYPKHHSYKYYGARGITVCEEWKNSFQKFYADMGNRPSKLLTLDRIDNNKGYYKENCRWATGKEQAKNSRPKITELFYSYNGQTLSLGEWAKKFNIERHTLHSRIKYHGMSIEQALLKTNNQEGCWERKTIIMNWINCKISFSTSSFLKDFKTNNSSREVFNFYELVSLLIEHNLVQKIKQGEYKLIKT